MNRYEKFIATTRANISRSFVAFDVSSESQDFSALSPFNNLGNIPHPCDSNILCQSVECIWQGSKVFDKTNIKPDYFVLFGKKSFMKNKGKKPLGTWAGDNNLITEVGEARRVVYVPAYRWVLEHRLKNKVEKLLYLALINNGKKILLYDFGWNLDIDNPAPLSHSAVLAEYLNEKYNSLSRVEKASIIAKFTR